MCTQYVCVCDVIEAHYYTYMHNIDLVLTLSRYMYSMYCTLDCLLCYICYSSNVSAKSTYACMHVCVYVCVFMNMYM